MLYNYNFNVEVEIPEIQTGKEEYERPEVDLYAARKKAIKDLESEILNSFNNAEIVDSDIDYDTGYIMFSSDEDLESTEVIKRILGDNSYFTSYSSEEVYYGPVHDVGYYEEPYRDSKEVQIEVTLDNFKLVGKDVVFEANDEVEKELFEAMSPEEDLKIAKKNLARFNTRAKNYSKSLTEEDHANQISNPDSKLNKLYQTVDRFIRKVKEKEDLALAERANSLLEELMSDK
jgi:hypothetical protein